MKEIKFKAKRKDNNEWTYGYLEKQAVKESISKNLDCAIRLSVAYEELKQRLDKAKELCKIVLDNEDKNQDLLDHISVIYRKLQVRKLNR